MAQAYVDFVRKEGGLQIIESSSLKVVCCLSLTEEITIKKSKGEIKLMYKKGSKRTTISEDDFNTLYNIAESIQLIASFLKGTHDVS